MGYTEQADGRECRCGAKTNLFVIVDAIPRRENWWTRPPSGPIERWLYRTRAWCVDRARCEARQAKKRERSQQRSSLLVVAEPKVPDAPRGQCRWCGELLTGQNASRRNYCYPEHEGRDCRIQAWRSRAWTARDAVSMRGDPCCAACGSENPMWQADHIVPLEDGGEHTMENLQRLCDPCHTAKTSRENAERARRRQPPSPQLSFEDAA